MSIVIVQKGNPTSTTIGNLWLEDQSDAIAEIIAENHKLLNNGDIIIHIINPQSLSTGLGGEVNSYIVDDDSAAAVNAPFEIALRDNAGIRYRIPLCDVGDVCAVAETPAPPTELETFTVFGLNDDDEPFTAVITADPGKVEEAARRAGASSPEYTNLVDVAAILKGDQTYLKVA